MSALAGLGIAFNLGLADRSVAATAALYDDVLDTIRYAESAGVDGVWIGQHHFDVTPGPIPSPLVLLAAAARETSRMALGTGIVTLPLEDPIRLAEDAGVLDVLAGGRVHLGVGTGGANLPGFAAFGLDSERRHALYDRRIARLDSALRGEPLADAGSPRIQPFVPGLTRRVWEGVTSEERARAAARRDHGIQLGAFFDPAGSGQHPKSAAYVDELRRAHPESEPRVAAFRFLYVGDSRDDVVARLHPTLAARVGTLGERAQLSGNPSLAGVTPRGYLERVALFGSPDDVVEDARRDLVLRDHATHLVANSSYHETFDAADARATIDALVTTIAPSLGWSPTTPALV
ncbi:LLM class flavin-dependent oxidoreductase [Cnuibacter physcomitrellae]|uniref:LLM class flavin-dependent oxidoreductase n=1 Tax=Cnuibacter physcomitrellae TaxID=1619308 RepID=UPI002175D189|nr:LLM class flavin-dependent oxidoreductase [Cnuibacter physcomitrellae]MCS5498644.1 LLM class flavin-dependent oxidoreductase [Cnuibacter physcomitrellae]